MSDKRYEANIIRATAVEPANNLQSTSAPGVWSIDEVVELQKKSKWPTVGNVTTDVEQVFSTFLYNGSGAARNIENGIALGNANDGGSVEFDGTGDYLNLSTPVVPASGQFSLEAFIYPTATTDEAIASQHSNATTGRFIFRLDNGKLNFNWAASELTDANSITANAWSHCLVTRDASNVIRLFVNGALRKSTTNSVTFDQTNFTIGASRIASPEKFFNGFISNVRVVSGAIPTAYQTSSTTEGAAIYTTPTSGLTAVSNTALLTCQGSTPLVDNSSNSYAITTNADAAARAFGPFTGTSGEGGLVWLKSRSDGSHSHVLTDTARGVTKNLFSNGANAEYTGTDRITSFNSNGFSIGNSSVINTSSDNYVSWTFRKQAKFFDIVTYTGNGVNGRNVPHNLGVAPGMIVYKALAAVGGDGSADAWWVDHRGLNANKSLRLNTTVGEQSNYVYWTTRFDADNLNLSGNVNHNGINYVVYLFAHNDGDGEFGPDQNEDIIKCGSYTGNETSPPEINLGFEPQWVLIKRSTDVESWAIFDNMRGVATGANDAMLRADTSGSEYDAANQIEFTSTGFKLTTAGLNITNTTGTYIYMAIRRPQAVPTAASQVFSVNATAGGDNKYNLGFVPDFNLHTRTAGTTRYALTRLLGQRNLQTNNENVLSSVNTNLKYWDAPTNTIDLNTAWWGTQSDIISWSWARARKYFDVVCYTGTGSARTVTHNLDVAPEMIWAKSTETVSSSNAWWVQHKDLATPYDDSLSLQSTGGASTGNGALLWNSTAPTSSVFSLGTYNGINQSTKKYVAYLFATLPGISKVGSYTGSSSAVNVDCGFTSGAKFILIKRSSASGDGWFTFDSVRGIVAGNDPFLYLNDQQAEFTSYDAIDPYSAGFTVTTALGGLNTNGSTYIFYAIAQ